MARALCTWAINRGGKNSVRNLRYGPRTQLVRGIYVNIHRKKLEIPNWNIIGKETSPHVRDWNWIGLEVHGISWNFMGGGEVGVL